MIRWYDYGVVFFFADMMSAAVIGIFMAPQNVLILAILLCLCFVGFDGYAKIRKKIEQEG